MPEMRDRLNHVCQDNDNWRQKLRNIDTKMDGYEKVKREDPGGGHERILHEILPTYWEVFHTHNIYQRKKNQLPSRGADANHLSCYGVGIFLVGYSSLPIVLSLAEIQPSQEIYFLYSSGADGTRDRCCEIADRMRAMLGGLTDFDALIDRVDSSVCDLNKFGLEVDNPSDPVETFKRIKEVIDNVGNKRIALDLTGGKKTMIGGGFTAGSILDFSDSIDMFYIDSLEYNPHRGSPKPGTEFLTQLENPYNVYNMQSVREAEKLFQQHNYEAAATLWDAVGGNLESHANRYGLEEEQDAVQKDLDMADCYGFWDAFDYKTACEQAKCYGKSWGYNEKHTNSSIDVLDILSEVENLETLFAEEARIIHYAVDRYQNAIRRMKSDRFDDAIVRFTQVVEILCKYKIYQIAKQNCLFDKSYVLVRPECCLDEEWSITKLIHFLFNPHAMYDYRYRITNNDVLLKTSNYSYDNTRAIANLIKHRNEFIHVKSTPAWVVMKKNAKKLQNLAWEFLKDFSRSYRCGKGLSFEELLELHRFRR